MDVNWKSYWIIERPLCDAFVLIQKTIHLSFMASPRHRRFRSPFASVFKKTRNIRKKLTKLETIKILVSLALPLAVGIFTLVTTIQNRNIALQERRQDLNQAEDEQQESVFVDYINDISRFRDRNRDTLNQSDTQIYIRGKTLAALRKLNVERRKFLFLFLQDMLFSSTANYSFLSSANFNGIQLNSYECQFRNTIFSGLLFHNATFTYCSFTNVRFDEVELDGARFSHSTLYRVQFTDCQMDSVHIADSILSEDSFNDSILTRTNLRKNVFELVNVFNVNLSGAVLPKEFSAKDLTIRNSILPNGTFSVIDDVESNLDLCSSLNEWLIHPLNSSEITNCSIVSRANNTAIIYTIPMSFKIRSILIDANQADFHFQFTRNDTRSIIMMELIFFDVIYSIQTGVKKRTYRREIVWKDCTITSFHCRMSSKWRSDLPISNSFSNSNTERAVDHRNTDGRCYNSSHVR